MPYDGEATAARQVLLVMMPFDGGLFPSLALSLLKAGLARDGIDCQVRYFSLAYIERLGRADFDLLNDNDLSLARLGEWVFAEAANGQDDQPFAYLADILAPECAGGRLPPALARAALAARAAAAAFIEDCVRAIDWRNVALLGLSSSFQQNMASLALARRVKALHPHVLVAMGGPNCAGEMGEELHRRYACLDVVCQAEGDRVFPALVRSHLAGTPIPDLPGLIRRDPDGASRLPSLPVDQIEDMDELPYPDHSDFYAQRAGFPAASQQPPGTVFETARGCWWGMKHHCTFCGLNGRAMSYRSKSAARAYDELVHVVQRCGPDVLVTDAILDLRYFDELLPRLAAAGPDISGFWQMKVNLKPEWISLLAEAGITRIQPGIEALDTGLLTLMRKGCTMLQNVQTMKLAAESGITVAWNLLYGFPGEDPAAYARTAALMPKLRHLQPPMNLSRTLADRFSPYFQHPETYGVTLQPVAGYGAVYPFEPASVQRLAYHFHMRSPALDDIETTIAGMRAEQRLWSAHHTDSALFEQEEATDAGTRIVVTDRRWGFAPRRVVLDAAQGMVLRRCRTIAAWHQIVAGGADGLDEPALVQAAERLLAEGFLLREGREYLALPLRQPGWQRAPTWTEMREAQAVRQAARRQARFAEAVAAAAAPPPARQLARVD
jgi:ribosomal peptide maturation radical SAM protein 1